MRKLVRIITLLLVLCAALVQTAGSQSVLHPADPLVTYDPAAPPTQPTWGEIGKWVRTVRLAWNTQNYKAYIYKGVAFRLHFPKTYNPTAVDGKKYPMLVFYHGLGEVGSIHDNEFQLYHGAQFFGTSVGNGTFDGYVLAVQSQGFFGATHYQYVTEIINYMIANNKLDPFQVSANGLSAGGQASWEMLLNHPTYVSALLPMSSNSIAYKDAAVVDKVKYTSIWNFQGGLDGSPAPSTANQVKDAMLAAGANFKHTEYPKLGHDTWNKAWSEPDFFPFMKRAYSSNPWALTGRFEFCPGDIVSGTLGLAPGFSAYEWRKDGVRIDTAVSNTLKINSLGVYSARVERNGVWSDWSRIPATIKIKAPTVSPAISVSGIASKVLPALDGSTTVQLEVPAGYVSYEWQREGDPAVLSTTRLLDAPVGSYKVRVTEQFGCSSNFSVLFHVINASGPNKPDPATNLIVSPLSSTSLKLDWSDKPSPEFNETGFEVYGSAQPGGPYKLLSITAQDVKTYTVTGLAANATHYFKVRAINNTSAAAPSNEAEGTTVPDIKAPSAPKDLVILVQTPSSISLSWTASTDDVGVDKYEIYVNGVKTYLTSKTQFTVSSLQKGNTYNFVVKAIDGAKNVSAASNQVTGRAFLKGLNYKHYTFTGTWNNLPNFNNLVPKETGTMPDVALSPRLQNDNYAFLWEGYITIPASGTYKFATRSDDGSKLYLGALNGTASPYNFSGSALVNNDGLHGEVFASSAAVVLTAGTYPIAIAFYEQNGGESMTVSWEYEGGGFSQVPASAYGDAPGAPLQSVTAPSNVSATPVSDKKINLSWTDNSNNESGFEIWRSISPFSNFITVGQTAANTTVFMDTTLNANTRYYYQVRAVGATGESFFDKIGQGVDYAYYEQAGMTALPNFNALTPALTGRSTNFTLGMQRRADDFAVKFSGTINIPSTAFYTFYTSSDAGSRLYIDGFDAAHLVVDNDGIHAATEKSGLVRLTQGAHTIWVTYFEATGSESLAVRISAPGLPKQAIPNTYLGVLYANATTLAPVTAPAFPNPLSAKGTSKTGITVTWSDKSANESYFELHRSESNAGNFLFYTKLPPNTTTYVDSPLYGNAVYYYKVRAVNSGGISAFSNADSAKTYNAAPVLTDVPNRTARYGASSHISLRATDDNGDALAFSAQGLPSFAVLTNGSNGNATITVNPSLAQQGVYPGIVVTVTDIYGDRDTTGFTLTVNDNFSPVIAPVANQTVNENASISIPLTATDGNAGDLLTWSVSGLPSSFTLTPGSNGTATLVIQPAYSAAGNYNVFVDVKDSKGGFATQGFSLTVTDVNPTNKIYVRMMAANSIGAPWNNMTGATATNFKDASNKPTGVGMNFQPGNWNVASNGPQTGNNSGVYPDAVLKDHYYFGTWWTPQTVNAVITGLNPAGTYNFTFHAGSIWDIAPDNGSVTYTIGSKSVSLYVQNNTANLVSLNNIIPAANGTVEILMSKGAGATAGYLNSIVITSLFSDGTLPAAASALEAQRIPGTGVRLSWTDGAYNESEFEVYRSTSAAGPFTLIGTAAADETAYTDNSYTGQTVYFYKVRAANSVGASAYTNTITVKTLNRVPQVAPIASVQLENNAVLQIPVSATDDAGDVIRLTASGLPDFATFTDNGNGTGRISLQPVAGSIGTYSNLKITARDNSDSSSSTTFSITVTDKEVSVVYFNFSDGGSSASKPWNNLSGFPAAGSNFTGITDENDVATPITVNYPDGFLGANTMGMRARNGKELFPEDVLRTAIVDTALAGKRIVVSGLNTALKYNFLFFNSREDGINGTTRFTINGQAVTLNAGYNINRTAQINGIIPDANGRVTITMARVAGADFALLSAMVLQSYDPALPLLAPADLRVAHIHTNKVKLHWQDRADNETAYEVWRSNAGSAFSLVATLAANSTTYIDTPLVANTTYHYSVRAKKAAVLSVYSNIARVNTYANTVHINFSADLSAPAPWNNTRIIPQKGYVFNNLKDNTGTPSSAGLEITGQFAGIYQAGVTTGNNTGVFPDAVMYESYGLFPGQSATIKLTGLDISKKYDLTFFASSQAWGDVNVGYTVNGKTSLLNASLNKTGTLTMYDIVTDEYGNIDITVAPGTQYSQFGLIGALIVQGYTPAAGITPQLPTAKTQEITLAPRTDETTETTRVVAYPNPFDRAFSLSVTAAREDRVVLQLFDASGKVVYQNTATVNWGVNRINVATGQTLVPGVYFLKVVLTSSKEQQVIRVIKR